MHRRQLLRSFFAFGGAAALMAIPNQSEAASLFDELKNNEFEAMAPDADFDADLPAEGAEDAQWRRRCWWTRDRRGRRIRVCRPVGRRRPWRRRRVRRCWWRRDRWGRRIRVCR